MTCKGATKLQFRQQEVSEPVTSNFNIINTNSIITEEHYSFQITLDLYHVDQYAIGYYACSDYSVKANIVDNIIEEPQNDENVSYIYVYVNGEGIYEYIHIHFFKTVGYLIIYERFRYG